MKTYDCPIYVVTFSVTLCALEHREEFVPFRRTCWPIPFVIYGSR